MTPSIQTEMRMWHVSSMLFVPLTVRRSRSANLHRKLRPKTQPVEAEIGVAPVVCVFKTSEFRCKKMFVHVCCILFYDMCAHAFFAVNWSYSLHLIARPAIQSHNGQAFQVPRGTMSGTSHDFPCVKNVSQSRFLLFLS